MTVNRMHSAVSFLLFLLIVCTYLLLALKAPLAYIVATYEDFFGEWAQVFFISAVLVLSLRQIRSRSSFRIFFIFMALVSFYVLMEEISWGQRIFNIVSPEFFKKYNLQRETNIHNLLIGPYQTHTKIMVEYVLFAALIIYGLILPLLAVKKSGAARFLESKGLLFPPLYLWPYFVFSGVLELGIFNFNEAEIAEILIPFGLSIFLMHYMVLNGTNNTQRPHDDASLDSVKSRKLAFRVCLLFLCALVFSTEATYLCYSSPRLKKKMDNKILNGMEKFGARYQRFEMWDNAVSLYLLVDGREPDRSSIQRELAFCYGKINAHEKERFYIEKAFELDRQRLVEMPSSISANLSIALTYRQTGNADKELFHLDRALHIALERSQRKPKSAKAAYWLGKTYLQRGDDKSALPYFEKAFRLSPFKKKFRSAYMRTLTRVTEKSDDSYESSEERDE